MVGLVKRQVHPVEKRVTNRRADGQTRQPPAVDRECQEQQRPPDEGQSRVALNQPEEKVSHRNTIQELAVLLTIRTMVSACGRPESVSDSGFGLARVCASGHDWSAGVPR